MDVTLLTVCLQLSGLTVSAASLINGLHYKDVLGATLQPMHCVVVLFYIWNNHPAVGWITQTCNFKSNTLVPVWRNFMNTLEQLGKPENASENPKENWFFVSLNGKISANWFIIFFLLTEGQFTLLLNFTCIWVQKIMNLNSKSMCRAVNY